MRPSLLREDVVANHYDLVVVDEVQKVPALLDEVHWCLENTKTRFILCGSSARKGEARCGQPPRRPCLAIRALYAFLSVARETQEDMALIRRELEQIKAILMRHEQMLQSLPEVIRDKIGFKTR